MAAYRENRVVEEYFDTLLRGSSFEWSAEQEAEVKAKADLSIPHDSEVSVHLVVGYSPRQLGVFSVIAVGALLLIAFGTRRFSTETSPD